MPMLADPLQDLKKPSIKGGFLVGYVVNNVDEDDKKTRQRVQIRVPLQHRKISDAELPWAIPDVGLNGYGNAGAGVGSAGIPPIGTKVYIRYDDSDPHNPRYSGSPSTDDVNKDNELFKEGEDYPHTRGTIDADNNRTSVNVEKKTQQQTHSSGTTIHIDANGTMSISTAGDYNLGVQGNCNISAKGNVNIVGAKITLNDGGSGPTSPTKRPRPQVPSPAGKTTY